MVGWVHTVSAYHCGMNNQVYLQYDVFDATPNSENVRHIRPRPAETVCKVMQGQHSTAFQPCQHKTGKRATSAAAETDFRRAWDGHNPAAGVM